MIKTAAMAAFMALTGASALAQSVAQDRAETQRFRIITESDKPLSLQGESIIVRGPTSVNFTSIFSPNLVSPDRVLERADEIGLTEAQREQIIDIVAEGEAALTRHRLSNAGRESNMDELLESSPIDREAALETFDRVVDAENALKRTRLAMMIDVRNVLSDAQAQAYREVVRTDVESAARKRLRALAIED